MNTVAVKYLMQLPSRSTFLTLYKSTVFPARPCLSGKTFNGQNTQLLQTDWLTCGLLHKIETLFPNLSEINSDDDNKRDSFAFQHKITLLFPCGRMFASFKKSDQASDTFLGA
jgi:hypothetical protein